MKIKTNFLAGLLISCAIAQMSHAMNFFSRSPIVEIKREISNYNIDGFRKLLAQNYGSQQINGTMISNTLSVVNQQKEEDRAKIIFKRIDEFTQMQKEINATEKETRKGYGLRGSAASTLGFLTGVPPAIGAVGLVGAWFTHEPVKLNRETTAILLGLGALGIISYKSLFYGANQLKKTYWFAENKESLKTIQRDLARAGRRFCESVTDEMKDKNKPLSEGEKKALATFDHSIKIDSTAAFIQVD